MARFQSDHLLMALLLLWAGVVSESCHPLSKELHICLNIYLERDLPLVETILKGSPGRGGGRPLLEGPTELQNICRHIWHLIECYQGLLKECNTYWQLERYTRLMNTFSATFSHLCGNSTNNFYKIKDVLLNGACVRKAYQKLNSCSEFSTGWVNIGKEILRMQVASTDRCPSIKSYRNCFLQEMEGVHCEKNAIKAYGEFLNVWLRNWCGSGAVLLTTDVIIPVTFTFLVLNEIVKYQYKFA